MVTSRTCPLIGFEDGGEVGRGCGGGVFEGVLFWFVSFFSRFLLGLVCGRSVNAARGC